SHLWRVEYLFRHAAHLERLDVRYADVVADPRREAERMNAFLGGRLDVEKMVEAVDPQLYRNRAARDPGPAARAGSAHDEPGIDQVELVVAQRLSGARVDQVAPRLEGEGVAGGGIPLHGRSEPGVDVSRPFGDQADLERAPHAGEGHLAVLGLGGAKVR